MPRKRTTTGMAVIFRVVVSQEARRALRYRTGRSGLATRYEITSVMSMMLDNEIADAISEYEHRPKRRRRAN